MGAYWRVFLAGTRASWHMYAVELTPSVFFGSKIPRPVFQALFFVLIAKAAGGDAYARYALIGNAVSAAVFIAVIFMATGIEIEKWAGTLPYLVAAPTHWLPLLLGRSVATFGDAFMGMVIVFGVLIPIFNPGIALLNLLRAVPFILLTVVSTSALGWLVGAISLPIRWGLLISNIVAYVMTVVCGVNFPITTLPAAVQHLSRALPLTHGLLAIRAIVDGASYSSVLDLAGKELLVGLIYGTLAWLVFGYRLRVLRKRGGLELV